MFFLGGAGMLFWVSLWQKYDDASQGTSYVQRNMIDAINIYFSRWK